MEKASVNDEELKLQSPSMRTLGALLSSIVFKFQQ